MSSKEVKIRVTGDVSDLLKKLEMVKDSFDDLNKGNTNNNKSIRSLFDDLSDVDKKIEKTADSMDDLADATGKVGKKNITGIADDLSDTNKKIDNTVKGFNDLNKQINDIDAKPFNAIDKQMASLYENTNDVKDAFNETFDMFDDFTNTKNKFKIEIIDDPDDFLNDITDNLMQASVTGKIVGNSISQSFDNVSDSISQSFDNVGNSISQSFNDINDTIKRSISSLDDLERAIKDIEDYTGKTSNPSAMKNYFDKLYDNTLNQMDKATENLDWDAFDEASKILDAAFKNWEKYRKIEKEALGDINKQVDAYKQLRQSVIDFINASEHSALEEKSFKYLEEARLALNRIGAEVEGIPKDVFDKLNKDVAEFTKSVNDSSKIISFDKIEKQLNRLGKAIEDKTVKLTSISESFESANWKARKATEGFEEASKSIVDFCNNAKYAFEKVEKDGQIIERLTTDFKKLDNAAQAEHIQEVNEALAEYQTLMREFGGDISERFITDGEFDPKKYVEAYEESGVPINQLTMRYKALKQQVLEYLQVEDESIENKAKAIKSINDYAKALRKLGAAAEDIDLSDIESFDKSLASNLNNTFKDLFDNDIPGNFKEIREELKAAFNEFNNLELGNAFDLLSNAGKGFAKNIFSKIPAQVKIAAVAIAGLTYVTNKLYEAGKQQFFEGLANIGNKLKPVINTIQSFGREAINAFEEITNTQLDLSSLMAIGPEFQYQMQKVGAIAGSNDKQLQKLTDTAERLGGTTQFTASQVGEAFEYMAKRTWSVMEKSIA